MSRRHHSLGSYTRIHTLFTLLRGETKDRGCEFNVCNLVLWDVFVSHLFSPGVRNSCHGDRVPRVTKAWGDNVSDREWSKIQPMVVKAQRTSSCQQADWLTMKKQRDSFRFTIKVHWRYFPNCLKCIFADLTEAWTKINVIQICPSHCVATDYHLNQKIETRRKLNLPLSVLPSVSTAYEGLNKMKAI